MRQERKEPTKAMIYLIIIACTWLLVGCAASIPPPPELINARQACAHASASPRTQLVPEALDKARVALARAEKAFRDNPDSYRTQGLASFACRAAKLAEELGEAASANTISAGANKEFPQTKTDVAKQD